MQMLDKFLSNEDAVVDEAIKEMERKDKARLRKADKKRVRDLDVRVTVDGASNRAFAISIKNVGTSIYRNLTFHYGGILLHAENFGIDTTHMPVGMECIDGEEICVAQISPGETVTFIRQGYATHDMYNKESKRVVRLTFADAERSGRDAEVSWVYAVVDLPNARKRRTEKFYGEC